MADLRSLPSVEKLLQTKLAAQLIAQYGRSLTLRAIREVLGGIRVEYRPSSEQTIPERIAILDRVRSHLETLTRSSLIPLINATGVILHTNLGRAPLSPSALQTMEAIAHGYSNLEFELASGKRGSRSTHTEALFKQLLGCEASLVVNNNASAVLLVLSALASRRRVILPRGQLVEIGGGFRVPDVMKQSGAQLVEIGTTNQVHLEDYSQALEQPASLVMRAHRSNFKMIGFTGEPELVEVTTLAHQAGVLMVDDLGSGALLNTEKFGLAHEPTVQESLAAGVDLVCFSGDKLLGGPQAGIIVGKADLITKLRKHPLARAVRADKTCLAALSATLMHYLKDEAESEIPIWRMISTPLSQIKTRASYWAKEIQDGEVIAGQSTIGGGSLPGETLLTWLLALDAGNAEKFMAKLRTSQPPIIARTENDRILFDPRTVLPEREGAFLVGLQNALKRKITLK